MRNLQKSQLIFEIDWAKLNDEQDDEDVKKGVEPSPAYAKRKEKERQEKENKETSKLLDDAGKEANSALGSFYDHDRPQTQKPVKNPSEEAKKKVEDPKVKETKSKIFAAIEKYGNEYSSSKQLPLSDVLNDIFVPGVRLKADAAIRQISSDLLERIKGKDWNTALEIIKKYFEINESKSSDFERLQRLAGIIK